MNILRKLETVRFQAFFNLIKAGDHINAGNKKILILSRKFNIVVEYN